MALTKTAVKGIGATLSIAALAVSGFFIVKPLYDESSENQATINSVQEVTQNKESQLTTLENGVDNYDEIQQNVDSFLNRVPAVADIESASRSISTAVVPGVAITSFTFGSEENIEAYETPTLSTSGYVMPEGFTQTDDTQPTVNEDGTETTQNTSVESFHRLPVEISITATDYYSLSQYLNNLSKQERLLNVYSVNSTTTSASGAEGAPGSNVTATIYAYTFVYSR